MRIFKKILSIALNLMIYKISAKAFVITLFPTGLQADAVAYS